ncbi:isocitrate lyase/phosphoenolpyruvate mutase family protein, partial [bacterium]|nr:isocitrate lyase/phosphoenolpyruvate mutase family protein [bacterium]
MKKTTVLRNAIMERRAVTVPGCHDALSARVIEQCGFEAIQVSGYGLAGSFLGKPDVGLIQMKDILDLTWNIAQAVNIPVMADIDTGGGNAMNAAWITERLIHMGVALYTAAWVLRGILGLAPGATIFGVDALMVFITALGLLTGIYTMVGGLLAVVWTESVQTILLLVGAIVITVVGYAKIGGWTELAQTLASNPHPLAGVAGSNVTWGTGNFLNMARGPGDPSGLAWYSILLGYPVLGIWYWCCDQTIVQRVLAARDAKHARLGPLFCAFLKIWPVFFFVLPGVICVALVQKNAFGGAAPA